MVPVYFPGPDKEKVIIIHSEFEAFEEESYVVFVLDEGLYSIGQELLSGRETTRAA